MFTIFCVFILHYYLTIYVLCSPIHLLAATISALVLIIALSCVVKGLIYSVADVICIVCNADHPSYHVYFNSPEMKRHTVVAFVPSADGAIFRCEATSRVVLISRHGKGYSWPMTSVAVMSVCRCHRFFCLRRPRPAERQ